MFPQFLFLESDVYYEPCQLAKHCRSIYPVNNNNKNSVSFSLVHFVVWRPSPTTSLSDFKYFATFVGDCSRITWLYLLKSKSDLCTAFKPLCNIVDTQFNTKHQVLRYDNRGEYLSHYLSSFFDEFGIVHQTTCSGIPEQNGVTKIKK